MVSEKYSEKKNTKSKKIALVLSWGGARGLAHIWVIEEFLAQGYEITSVVGTSIGALIGGVYTLGKLAEFKSWFCSLSRLNVLSYFDISYRKPWLIKGEKVFTKMQEIGKDKAIETLPIPYKALATDLVTGNPYVFESWSVYEAIRASVAIPTVVTPFVKGDMVLVDGGVLNNIPVQYAEKKDDEIVVVVDLWANIPSQITPYQTEEKESIYDEFIGSVKDTIEKYSTIAKEKYLEKYEKLVWKSKNTEEEILEKKKELDWWYSDIVQKSISVMMRKLSDISLEESNPDILISLSKHNATTFDFHKAKELIALWRDYAKKAIAEYEQRR